MNKLEASESNKLAQDILAGKAEAPRIDKATVIMHAVAGKASGTARKVTYKKKGATETTTFVTVVNATGKSEDGTEVPLNVYNLASPTTEDKEKVNGTWGYLGIVAKTLRESASTGGAGSSADNLLKWVIAKTGKTGADQPTDAELEAVRFPGMLVA